MDKRNGDLAVAAESIAADCFPPVDVGRQPHSCAAYSNRILCISCVAEVVPLNTMSVVTVPDPSQLQNAVNLSEIVGITRFDADYYPLQLGNHVLGGGFYATRLYHDLRQVNGYVYSVDVHMNATKTRTVYAITYACDPANVSKARQLIERDLMSMQKENVTPAELQQAKALVLRQLPLGESGEDAVAGGLLARAQLNLPLDEAARAARSSRMAVRPR